MKCVRDGVGRTDNLIGETRVRHDAGVLVRGLCGDWLRKRKRTARNPLERVIPPLQRCFRQEDHIAVRPGPPHRPGRQADGAIGGGNHGIPCPTRSPTTWARRARSQHGHRPPWGTEATALSRATRTPRTWRAGAGTATTRLCPRREQKGPVPVSSTRQTRWPTTRAGSGQPNAPRTRHSATTSRLYGDRTLPARRVAARATCSPRSPRAWGA